MLLVQNREDVSIYYEQINLLSDEVSSTESPNYTLFRIRNYNTMPHTHTHTKDWHNISGDFHEFVQSVFHISNVRLYQREPHWKYFRNILTLKTPN